MTKTRCKALLEINLGNDYKIIKEGFCDRIGFPDNPKESLYFAQTHFHYSLKDDTWTLCSEFNGKNNLKAPANKCVSSLEDLIKHFRTIHIGEKDSLFIGNRQILKSDAPSFFK